jgi:hypothetical protein
MKAWFANVLVGLQLRRKRMLHEWRLSKIVRDPMRTQHAVLKKILADNSDTRFGLQHGFAQINDYVSFVKHVPVQEFEQLRPFIDAEIEHNEAALTAESPQRYVRTSGTTGQPKNIPLTSCHLDGLRRIQETAVAFQYRTCPAAFAGSILAIVSPEQEGVLPNGKAFGSASGILAGNTPWLVQEKFIIPTLVLSIHDSRIKYLLILRLALARADISYVGAANPTTLLTLAKLYREYQSDLIRDLREGGFFLADALPPEVLVVVQLRLKATPERAEALSRLQRQGAEPRIADLWPQLRLIVTWTCASAGVAVEALRRELSPVMRILELGYIASEFRGTITVGKRAGSGLPTLDTHFFEFVERAQWEAGGESVFLTLAELRKDVDYYVIVTTPSGLYRYFINDLVRVQGFLRETPLIKFLQKGKGVTNITGEKLSEAQVLAAVRGALAGMDINARFIMMLADEVARCYHLYVESDARDANAVERPGTVALAAEVCQRLAQLNIEYHAKRESQRLGPLVAHWLRRGLSEVYKQYCVQQGQREGQFKTIALAYQKDFTFDLNAHVEKD